MDLHLERIIPSFLQLTEENTNKISKFFYALNPVYLSALIVSIEKFIANMRQEFSHRKLNSGKSHWLYIRDMHAWSTGHPRKTRACSRLCYPAPSFLTLYKRLSSRGDWFFIIRVVGMTVRLPDFLVGFFALSDPILARFPSWCLSCYLQKQSFFSLSHVFFRQEDKHRKCLDVSNVGLCDGKSQLISQEW